MKLPPQPPFGLKAPTDDQWELWLGRNVWKLLHTTNDTSVLDLGYRIHIDYDDPDSVHLQRVLFPSEE